MHWEYFYDAIGKSLVRLYRIMGELRRNHRALGSLGFFYYFDDPNHRRDSVIAFRREAAATATQAAEAFVIILNFSEAVANVWIPWPAGGQWNEQIDSATALTPTVNVTAGQWLSVAVPSHYGAVYAKQ